MSLILWTYYILVTVLAARFYPLFSTNPNTILYRRFVAIINCYDDSYEPDEEEYDEEIVPSSSSKKVAFDTAANITFKAPRRPLRRYIPDFDSLPKTGVWISPAPGRHTEFMQVVVRTTKCDICNEKVGTEKEEKVMQRCRHCNTQFCKDCELRVSNDDRHFHRPVGNFKENMYSRPKTLVRPVRPLTASERLAGMRTILPGTFNTVAVNTPTPLRRPRLSKATTSTKKKNKKKRSLPPGYTSDEVDTHFQLDWEFIEKLPIEMQRKELKEASMRALMRKRTLEVMEAPAPSELEDEAALYNSRTPLPSSSIPRSAISRRCATPSSMATRRSRVISKSISGPRIAFATTGDSETTSQPLQYILDGLSQNRQVSEQAEVQDPNLIDEHGNTSIEDNYDEQDYLQMQSEPADEEEYQPGYD
ncbi:hypothetical protein DID88_004258 [Monilinia fructigena]|uniref:B box-type domain-containing protein n=1 Tax=Monilinia fructigena TaxID=38457 RepID=A0A395IXW3_9HELO|nr:hypothetical protein DID88_004258 [Monilinia fructigena]